MTTVMLTRQAQDGALTSLLQERGYGICHVAAIAVEPVQNPDLDEAVRTLASFDWIAVTSAAAVRALVEAAGRLRVPLSIEPPRWASVGPSTARALTAAGIPVAVSPEHANGAAIPAALAASGGLAGARILLPRSDLADDSLPRALREAGADVTDVVAYRTIEGPHRSRAPLRHALASLEVGAIVVASGSAARGIVALAEGSPAADALRQIPFVSIGASTSAEVRRLGLTLAAESAGPTPEALADAVAAAVAAKPRPSLTAPEPAR